MPTDQKKSISRSRSGSRHNSRSRSTDKNQNTKSNEGTSAKPSNLILTGLSKNINADHLKEIFGNYGKVLSAKMMFDKKFNFPTDTGFVTYEKREEANRAIAHLDSSMIDGKVINVRFTQSDDLESRNFKIKFIR